MRGRRSRRAAICWRCQNRGRPCPIMTGFYGDRGACRKVEEVWPAPTLLRGHFAATLCITERCRNEYQTEPAQSGDLAGRLDDWAGCLVRRQGWPHSLNGG